MGSSLPIYLPDKFLFTNHQLHTHVAFKSFLLKPLANLTARRIDRWRASDRGWLVRDAFERPDIDAATDHSGEPGTALVVQRHASDARHRGGVAGIDSGAAVQQFVRFARAAVIL